MAKKIKVFELDFGDTNLIDKDINVLLEWIKSDAFDLKEGDELTYTITTRQMTERQYNNLPEWS